MDIGKRCGLKNKGFDFKKMPQRREVGNGMKKQGKQKVRKATTETKEIDEAQELLSLGTDLGLKPLFSDNDILNIIIKRLKKS